MGGEHRPSRRKKKTGKNEIRGSIAVLGRNGRSNRQKWEEGLDAMDGRLPERGSCRRLGRVVASKCCPVDAAPLSRGFPSRIPNFPFCSRRPGQGCGDDFAHPSATGTPRSQLSGTGRVQPSRHHPDDCGCAWPAPAKQKHVKSHCGRRQQHRSSTAHTAHTAPTRCCPNIARVARQADERASDFPTTSMEVLLGQGRAPSVGVAPSLQGKIHVAPCNSTQH